MLSLHACHTILPCEYVWIDIPRSSASNIAFVNKIIEKPFVKKLRSQAIDRFRPTLSAQHELTERGTTKHSCKSLGLKERSRLVIVKTKGREPQVEIYTGVG